MTFDLRALNDDQPIKPGDSGLHGIIDLTIANPGEGPNCREWRLVVGLEQASASDHRMIVWRWMGKVERVSPEWKIRVWALTERLDGGGEDGWPDTEPKLEVVWGIQAEARPTLADDSTAEDLEDGIEWIQSTLVRFLNKHVRQITICARSERWRNEGIKGKRRQLDRILRWKRSGTSTASRAAAEEAKKALRRPICKARREC